MDARAPVYEGDIKPLEFTVAVTVGGIGSAVLSGLRVHPLVSVGFALAVMGVMALLRWRIASEHRDWESLEAFAEDIYLLGYLLTLAALLGLAPRLMSDETNLFSIAGLKLVTTVVGLALMMIFRQTARRWAQGEEQGEVEKFREQQRLFSEAVRRLNEGADELTTKLDEVVRRFDPGMLVPIVEWSNRAVTAFGAVTKSLEAVPTSVEKSLSCVGALGSDLEKARLAAVGLAGVMSNEAVRSAGLLAGELAKVGKAADHAGVTLTAVQPAGEAARGALEKVGVQAGMGAAQFNGVRLALEQTSAEMGRLEVVLKQIARMSAMDVNAPTNRLVQALDVSAARALSATGVIETLGSRVQDAAAVGKELSTRVAAEVATPLAEHRVALGLVQQQVGRAADQLREAVVKLESMLSAKKVGEDFSERLLGRLDELHSTMAQTNGHLERLAGRLDSAPGAQAKPSILGFFRGR